MRNIVLIGMKASGKSTLAKELVEQLNVESIELDDEIEKLFLTENGEKLSFREIFLKKGRDYFRKLENKTLKKISLQIKNKSFVLSCGGGTPLLPENRTILKKLGKIFFLDTDRNVLMARILKMGLSAFFKDKDNPEKSLNDILKVRRHWYEKTADIVVNIKNENPSEIANKIIDKL